MALSFAVGGARGAFEETFADEVTGVLDHAYGCECDWERAPIDTLGELTTAGWSRLVGLAIVALGADMTTNLTALRDGGRGVFLPAHVQAASFPLSAGEALRCASLPGLRTELAELAERWRLPLDEPGLRELIEAGDGDGEHEIFARVALAANEAARRDCPLWLIVR